MARSPMKFILVLLTLALCGGLVWGGLWVYRRGLNRENLQERAERALREQRYDDAIALARQALEAEPELDAVKITMLHALLAAQRLDEARTEAEAMLADPDLEARASESLCVIALQQNRLGDAQKIARSLVATDPGYAYRVLSLIEDVRGLGANDWKRRLEAAQIRRSLVAVSQSDADTAEALLFAAQISLEVTPFLQSSEALVVRARADLGKAVEAASRARQQNQAYPYELVTAMIRVLSDRPEDAEAAARLLRKYTQGLDRNEQAIAELAKFHLRRDENTEAVNLIRELKDSYLWLRVFWILRQGKHRDVALEVLDSGPIKDPFERDLLRGDLQLQSDDEALKTKGRDLLVGIARNPEASTPQVLRALLFLALRVDLETARKVAEDPAVVDRNDRRITAFLASLLSSTEEDKERGLEMARELAQGIDTSAEGGEILGMLSGAGGQAMERFLDAQVEKGGEAGFQARLQRAVATLGQVKRGEGEDAPKLRTRVVDDLEAMLRDENATKTALLVAFNMAAGLEQPKLAGRLMARALTMKGSPEMLDARLLQLVAELGNKTVAEGLAAGVRDAAKDSSAPAYLGLLADGLEKGISDRGAYRARLEEIAATEAASRVFTLNLAARIAFGDQDYVEAERLARQVLEIETSNPSALETLGASYLKRGASAEVLKLYEGRKDIPEIGHCQVVGALIETGRRDDALRKARDLLETHPSSAMIHVLLAQVYLDRARVAETEDQARRERQAALGVLNLAPSNPYVLHMRAELLREFGDFGLAEQIYEVLLLNSRFQDPRSWRGLADVLSRNKREAEFIEKSGVVLKAGHLDGIPEVKGLVQCLRGVALEREGRVEEALLEYEEAIRCHADNWMALNNAAWQIATSSPARIEEARGYIDRAMELQPDAASLLDTAAEVYAVLGNGDKALNLIDRALMLKPEGKMASYTLHRGRILLRLGREEDAKRVFQQVRTEYADSPAAGTARDLLWEIERKNMPDRPEEEVVLPPDEETPAGGAGG